MINREVYFRKSYLLYSLKVRLFWRENAKVIHHSMKGRHSVTLVHVPATHVGHFWTLHLRLSSGLLMTSHGNSLESHMTFLVCKPSPQVAEHWNKIKFKIHVQSLWCRNQDNFSKRTCILKKQTMQIGEIYEGKNSPFVQIDMLTLVHVPTTHVGHFWTLHPRLSPGLLMTSHGNSLESHVTVLVCTPSPQVAEHYIQKIDQICEIC